MTEAHKGAYEYCGNNYCPGHAVWLMATVPEFMEYERSGGRLFFSDVEVQDEAGLDEALSRCTVYEAEADLNRVASFLGIERHRAMPWEFPLLLDGPPYPPSFCTECLLWFDPLPHDMERGEL